LIRKKKNDEKKAEIQINTHMYEFTRCNNYVEHRQRDKKKERKKSTHNSNENMKIKKKIDNFTSNIIVPFVSVVICFDDDHCSSQMDILNKHL
jgi:hypothetical protein